MKFQRSYKRKYKKGRRLRQKHRQLSPSELSLLLGYLNFRHYRSRYQSHPRVRVPKTQGRVIIEGIKDKYGVDLYSVDRNMQKYVKSFTSGANYGANRLFRNAGTYAVMAAARRARRYR